ncbi:hypothetical protein QVD17_04977 [Tagetes erecta]|uniref:Uncharacterized protein n=1 Tax=Tagetes erecta TaxID=13708 RepID=A0AAD8LCX8_TARER|nr:hypothetical protein QVD17_04977 [Tagetes erecta]
MQVQRLKEKVAELEREKAEKNDMKEKIEQNTRLYAEMNEKLQMLSQNMPQNFPRLFTISIGERQRQKVENAQHIPRQSATKMHITLRFGGVSSNRWSNSGECQLGWVTLKFSSTWCLGVAGIKFGVLESLLVVLEWQCNALDS